MIIGACTSARVSVLTSAPVRARVSVSGPNCFTHTHTHTKKLERLAVRATTANQGTRCDTERVQVSARVAELLGSCTSKNAE